MRRWLRSCTTRRCWTSRRSWRLFERRRGWCSRTSAWRQRCERNSPRCAASRTRIVAATDAERRRIERNLHDGAQQRLVTLSLALGIAAGRQDGGRLGACSTRARDEVDEAIAELRELARGIHPTLLREEGLLTAVEALARRTPLPVTVRGLGRGSPARRRRAGCLLPGLGGPHERRQARRCVRGLRCASSAQGGGRCAWPSWTTEWVARAPAWIRAWQASATGSRCWTPGWSSRGEFGAGTTISVEIPCGS